MQSGWLDRPYGLAMIFGATFAMVAAFIGITDGRWTTPKAPPKQISTRPLLVVYETQTCGWCIRLREDAADTYQASDAGQRAPLVFIDKSKQGSSEFHPRRFVSATPTLIVMDTYGREVERMTGYPGGPEPIIDFVEKVLDKMGAE